MTINNTDNGREEQQYKRDKRRLFVIELLMVTLFCALVLYCFWRNSK